MGICRRYTKTRNEAEDVCQDAFVKVFNSISQLKASANLSAWIRKITINTAVEHYHRNKKHEHVNENVGQDFVDDEYDHILSMLTDEMVVTLINQLPDGYRMVFNLSVIEGYSHGEIAKILGINESSSRSQLNRARQVLKSKLNSMGIHKYERYA